MAACLSRVMGLVLVMGWFLSRPLCAVGDPASGPATRAATRPELSEALVQAIQFHDVAAVRRLLSQGADVNAGADSPLSDAAMFDNVEIAQLLLDRGANPDSINNWGCPALYCAVWRARPEMVKLLLDRGARAGLDPGLRIAASHDKPEIMRLLIAGGANVNAGDINGETALHRAAMKGHVKAAQVLIDAGADVNAKDLSGETPMDYATEYHRQDVANLLDGANAAKGH